MSLSQPQVATLLAKSDPEWAGTLKRVLNRVLVLPNECWMFLGAKNPAGYGVVGRGGRGAGTILTHRATYAALVGPLAKGMEIDHICKVEGCCNPRHLEQVTPDENRRRSWVTQAVRAMWQSQTHCSKGHELTEQNTYVGTRNGNVIRQCRACRTRPVRRARKEATS